jgi:hypothetical protein
VGKTSLVAALAARTGHQLVRINLSEQTDMMDLLGTDLPTADGGAGAFQWSDGAFLAAVKVRPLPCQILPLPISRYRFNFQSNLIWDSIKSISNFCFEF